MTTIYTKVYRQGANAIIINTPNIAEDSLFLIVQKAKYKNNEWDFAGGGIENNETPEQAVLREITEELGTNKFKILFKSSILSKFNWPEQTKQQYLKKCGILYAGQEKFQFIVQFLGDTKELNFQKEEIKQIKWVNYSNLSKHLIFEGQWETVKSMIEEFANI